MICSEKKSCDRSQCIKVRLHGKLYLLQLLQIYLYLYEDMMLKFIYRIRVHRLNLSFGIFRMTEEVALLQFLTAAKH
jgi:hypothetical protein